MPADSRAPFSLCVVCFPYFPSKDTGRGHDRYVFELVENLRANAADVRLEVIDQGFSRGVRAAASKLADLVKRLVPARADVYHAISPLGASAVALLGKRPLVVTIHDVIPFHIASADHSWKLSLVRACLRLSVARSAAVIVPYEVTKRELTRLFGTPPEKIHVVNYGVDHDVYHPQPDKQRDPDQILYIGEVSRSKGVDVLLRAFRLVKQALPQARLCIGGKPSRDQAELERLCSELQLRDFTFAGFIPEATLAERYATTSVMVFPSRVGFGLSTLEAMACGTPVVVAAALDAPEFIADAGLLVQPDDPEALANAIIRALSEPGLKQELSSKASARASQFAWARMAAEAREVYARVRER